MLEDTVGLTGDAVVNGVAGAISAAKDVHNVIQYLCTCNSSSGLNVGREIARLEGNMHAILAEHWEYKGYMGGSMLVHFGFERELSEEWSVGISQETENLRFLQSNLQSFAVLEDRRAPVLAEYCYMSELLALAGQGPTAEATDKNNCRDMVRTDFIESRHWILDAVFLQGVPVVLPLWISGFHYVAVFFEPVSKTIYCFDSSQTKDFEKVVNTASQLAASNSPWQVKKLETRMQFDGWSCGIWVSIFCALCCEFQRQRPVERFDIWLPAAIVRFGIRRPDYLMNY